MENLTTIETSNNLIFRTSKTLGNETIYVTIRLNDECKNGHQDFSITGDLYQANKPKSDRYHLSGGCIHEEILKFFPEFKMFVNLHLCDFDGVPMHPTANGFYHLSAGFNNAPANSQKFKDQYCEYYRISGVQFDILAASKTQTQYALNLQKLGILEQWKKEALKGIKELEFLKGKKFLNDSKRSQYIVPTDEEIEEENKRQREGYYTKASAQKRSEERKEKIISELKEDAAKKINSINDELNLKIMVLNMGGEGALKNCIYYTHTKQLAFNWKSYEKIPESLIQTIKDKIILPEGVTIINNDAK